jgi:SAM-dependent methyltransferase
MSDRAGLYRLFERAFIYDAAQYIVRSRRTRAAFFQTYVRAEAGMRILDFGCGTGDALRHLPEVDYAGVDANPDYLHRVPGGSRVHSTLLAGDVQSLEAFPDAHFDIVLALGVLHHLDDRSAAAALAGFGRVLRPSGRFVAHDPVVTTGQGRLARWFVRHDRGRHVRSVPQVRRLAEAAFGHVRHEIVARPLRIPFTEIAIVCTSPKAVVYSNEPLPMRLISQF